MKYIHSRFLILFASSFIFISLFVCGCGGGGGGSSSLSFFESPSNISVKLMMMNRTSNAAYVSIPANAVGSVNISVVSIKSGKEVANQNVDYSLSAFTFDNQIPAGDTYSVIVTARLKERANDIYESIWQGSGKVAVLNAEKAAKTPGANEVSVALSFKTIEYIKLYPAKIIFDPAMPVAEITTSTLIPSFKLSVLDQFGNVMTSENSLISVGIESGSFKDSLNSKNLINGSVYFSNLAVASLIPDSAGFVKLKASYGSLSGYSSPVKTAGVAIPDSAVAGYLADGTPAAAPSAGQKSNAPLANKTVKLVCGSLQYITTTDASGFFRFDVKAGGANITAYIEFVNPQGVTVKLSTSVSGGRMKLARIVIDGTGSARLLSSTLDGAYNSAIDAAQLKKAVDDEIAAKSASGSAAGVSGIAVDSANRQPIPSAVITIGQLGLSSQTDAAGRFSISASAGQLAAGEYVVSFSRSGYLSASKSISVSSFDYGFVIEAVTLEAPARQNTPPSIAIKSVAGASQNISIVFDLFDADGDPCNIEVQYSLNGGYSYLPTVNAGGSLASAVPGSGLSAVWFSASDFLTSQTSVRVKLIPRDYASTGAAGESAIFAVNNEIVDPENNPPVIMGVMASGAAGDIAVSYDLIDQDGDSCAVELYYSLDGGATFTRSASYSIYSQRAFPAAGLSLVWNSALDFQTEEKSVKLRLTPNDSKSGGTPGESGIFTVNNIKNTPPVIQNLSVSGNYKDLSIFYDLIELDGHLCTVEVAYSIDGGASYIDTAYLSGETSSVAAGQSKTLIWQSFYDFTATNKSVFVKLTPSDKYGHGTEAIFGPFEVNNGGGAPSIAGLTVSGASQIIDIAYELIDIDASASTVEVYFSLDGGSSFKRTGYVEGDISLVAPGAGKSIKWNSYGDFRTRESSVVLKLLPVDSLGAGTEAVSLPFEINNNLNRPSITNVRTKGDSGEIEIAYDIDDLDGSTCQVMFQYATEKSAGYLSSLFVTGETAEVYSGVDKLLTWNSKGDLPGNFDSVSVKLIVSDDEGFGAEAVSAPFKVYNNSTGEILINSVAGSSQNITVSYNYNDPEGDAATVEVSYSRDGGATFIKTNKLSGALSGVLPASDLTLVWQSGQDIVNQNASGVLLKLSALDSAGKILCENISQPFAVNNYIPPVIPPKIVSAEFVEGIDSIKSVKVTFDAPLNPSSIIDSSKILLKGGYIYPNSPKSNSPGARSFIVTNNVAISGSSLIISQINGIYNDQDYVFGVTGDFVAMRGLQILSGSGIKNNSGVEVQPTSAPFAISRLLGIKKVLFSNENINFSATSFSPASPAGSIDIFIGAGIPSESSSPLGSLFPDGLSYFTSADLPYSYTPGDHVYYRYVSADNTMKSVWADFGMIPDAVSIFESSGTKKIAWSNARSEADVLSGPIGNEGDLLSLYFPGDIGYNRAVCDAAPAGGYITGSYSMSFSNSPINAASQAFFSITSKDGIESSYYLASAVLPSQPSSLSSARLKYNSANYQVYITTYFTLANDVRVYVVTDAGIAQKLGRIPAGTYDYLQNQYITVYSETATPSSLNGFSASGTLKFTSVDSAGNESAAATASTVSIVNPLYISWTNAGGANPAVKISTAFGSMDDQIIIYEKSGTNYSQIGTINASSGGFDPMMTYYSSTQTRITAGNIVAYKCVNSAGNESPIVDDGVVPAPPSGIAANLKLAYNGSNYEVKNTGAAVTLAGKVGVYVGETVPQLIGAIDNTVSPSIAASSFPNPNSYLVAGTLQPSLNKTLTASGGKLKFTYMNDARNESIFISDNSNPGVSDSVPAKPDTTNLSFLNPVNKIKILSYNFGGSGETMTLYEKISGDGSYLYKGYITPGPFAVGNEYAVSTQLASPLISTGNSAAYSIRGVSGNESLISDGTDFAGVLHHFNFSLSLQQVDAVPFTGVNSLVAKDAYDGTVTNFDASANNVTISVETGTSGTITGLGSGNNNILDQSIDFTAGICDLTGKMAFLTGSDMSPRTFRAASSDAKQGVSNTVYFTNYFDITAKVVTNGDASDATGAATGGWNPGNSTEEGGYIELTVTAKTPAGGIDTSYANKSGALSINSGLPGVVQWEGAGITDTVYDSSDNNASYNATFSNGIAYIYLRNSRAGSNLTATVTDGTAPEIKGSISLSWAAEASNSAIFFEGENSKGFRKYQCTRDSTVKMTKIPAGPFERGDGAYGGAPSTMRMSSYYIAESPTTNLQFKTWRLAAGDSFTGNPETVSGVGSPALQGAWGSDTGLPLYQDHPALYITWNDAKRYSYWLMTGSQSASADGADSDSQYLMTEAQYEKAARGIKFMNWNANDAASKIWPWGVTSPTLDTFCNTFLSVSAERPLISTQGTAAVLPSGYNPMGYYALNDIAGNARQWCRDWWDGGAAYLQPAGSLDPLNNTVGNYRVFRGGSWGNSQPELFRASYRGYDLPVNGDMTGTLRPVLKP